MARHKRRSQRGITPQQTKASARKLWYTLTGVVVIGLIIVGIRWYSRVGENTSRTPEPQTPPRQSNIRRGSQGYVKWQTQETDLKDGKKQIQGTIYWNEQTGANNEPVVGMPLHLATADHKKKELVVIANGITDSNGHFALIVPTTGDIRLGCDFEKARNIPNKVILEQERKNRSVEDQKLIEKLVNIEAQVNSETAWGSKVNRWINAQGTSVYVDYSGPAPAWYDAKTDRIVVNPQKTLLRDQLLEELKKGYLHTFILRFHEELHRAQNQRSGKTHANAEMALLREIHAYWLSHLSSVEQLYEYIYRNSQSAGDLRAALPATRNATFPPSHHPKGIYQNLHRVHFEQFSRLCAMIDWLYAYFDGDFDKLAEHVGHAESVAEFMQKTQTLIDSKVADRDVFVQRADQMWQAKQEWRNVTAQLTQEVLGQ